MNIEISVIIPVYNVEKYLKKCLDSIIHQTLKDIEIIIVNDGSTDNSSEICKEYRKNDSRILIIEQENNGLGAARNIGLQHAKGKYVTFVDSDDFLDRVTLERCLKKANNNLSDIVVFGFERIDELTQKTIQVRDDLTFDLDRITKDDFFKKVISSKFKHMVCSMIIKRELFRKNCLKFPSTLHEDIYVTPKLFFYAKKIDFINKNYYKWLIREGSITNTVTENHIDGIITAIFDIKSFLLKENILIRYEKEFTHFYLIYLNMIYKRIKSYTEDKEKKEQLIKKLILNSSAILDINQISVDNSNKFKEFINLYKQHIKYIKKEDDLISLQIETYNIKNSKAYKLVSKYHKYRDKYLPLHSKRRKFFKYLINMFSKKKNKNPIRVAKKNSLFLKNKSYKYDIIFIPHKDYHLRTMGSIIQELAKFNIKSVLIDITNNHRDEGVRSSVLEFPKIDFLDVGLFVADRIDYKVLVCMNDWDPKSTKPFILKSKIKNKKTVGIIEGINDFLDKDVHWKRDAYQTVEYLLMTGEHDKNFFENKKDKSFVVGIPRLNQFLKESVSFPKKPLVVINVNFTYGVLEHKREFWIKTAIEGCKKINIDYIITQHPADRGDLSEYNVSNEDMYETIRKGSIVVSRFSSIILESLAMGKPVIYHNPHNEKVEKFQKPMDAYSVSFDSNSLADAIKYELSLNIDYRKRANKFLDYHCDINNKKSASLKAAEHIKNILEV